MHIEKHLTIMCADWGASSSGEVVMEGNLRRRANGLFSFARWKQHWGRVTFKAISLTSAKEERGIDPKKYFVVNDKLSVRHEPHRVS